MNCIDKFFSDTRYAISWGILGIFIVSILLSVFLVFQTINIFEDKEGIINSVTVIGEGEVFVVPDIATFSFTARKTADTISGAQENVNERMNNAISFLKENGVEDKDIKTTSYNAYPKYEWVRPDCFGEICPPGKQEMIGYDVTQTISVKVRDTESIGGILDGIGVLDLDNISSLSFDVDDQKNLQNQARAAAIKDAREQADVLAKELGVKINDIVSFSESSSPFTNNDMYSVAELYSSKRMDAAIPTGESQIISTVHITFEIE